MEVLIFGNLMFRQGNLTRLYTCKVSEIYSKISPMKLRPQESRNRHPQLAHVAAISTLMQTRACLHMYKESAYLYKYMNVRMFAHVRVSACCNSAMLFS